MPTDNVSKVEIGMLGYGNRLPSTDVLRSWCKNPLVAKLCLHWNEPGPDVEKVLVEIKKLIPDLGISVSQINLGSAGGYTKLIENYRDKSTAPYLLLLDDDLRLAPDCIDKLVEAAGRDSRKLANTLFVAYRPGLPELADLVTKNKAIRRPRAGCCIGFHFLNIIKPNLEPIDLDKESGFYSIGSAPWGGLMIPRQALPKLGLPRQDFFLYAEDYELTARFTWNGGKIVLVPSAIIEDVDTAWNAVGGDISGLERRMLHLPDTKVFHEVRNRNFMARKYYRGFLPFYLVNKYLYLISAYAFGLFHGKLLRAKLIHLAINEGEKMAKADESTQVSQTK